MFKVHLRIFFFISLSSLLENKSLQDQISYLGRWASALTSYCFYSVSCRALRLGPLLTSFLDFFYDHCIPDGVHVNIWDNFPKITKRSESVSTARISSSVCFLIYTCILLPPIISSFLVFISSFAFSFFLNKLSPIFCSIPTNLDSSSEIQASLAVFILETLYPSRRIMRLSFYPTRATSFPGSSLYLEEVPWLRLVTCRIMRLDKLSALVRLERRTKQDSSS